MSTASASAPADAAPAKRGKKKLLIMIGAAVLVLGLAGGGTVFYLKSRAAAQAEAEAADDAEAPAHAKPKAAKKDSKHAPTFVPLDPFTVNLADREAERYAQVGVSLELDDSKSVDQIRTYMPVIRNNILMVLAHKTSAELLERDGKTRLAREIQHETAKALGIEFDAEEEDAAADKAGADAATAAKKKRKKASPELPVTAVHFSNFIIQ